MIDFWQFTYERQAIWFRRHVMKWPRRLWTSDEILGKYRFTNIHRELDAGTITLRQMVQRRLPDTSLEAVVFNTMLYRIFNRAEMWQVVDPFVTTSNELEGAIQRIRDYRDAKGKIATKAWTVSSLINYPGDTWLDRVEHCVNLWRPYDITADMLGATSFMDAFERLRGIPALGITLRTQICLDFTYLFSFTDDEDMPLYQTLGRHAGQRDKAKTANIGPAAGLELAGATTLQELRDRQDEEFAGRGLHWEHIAWEGKPRLTIADIEHTLCEYSKYIAVAKGYTKHMRIYG